MTGKIFRSIFGVAMAVLAAALVVITGCMYGYFGDVGAMQLREELALSAAATEEMGEAYLRSLDAGQSRLTWVGPDGTVIYDTQVPAEKLENHGDREEIREALSAGRGSSSRYSATLTEKTLYEAVRLSDGSVLRISKSYVTAAILAVGMFQPVLLVGILAVILSVVLARRMAKRVVEPLNRLDLEHPLDNDVYEELSPLLHRIHTQQREINFQMRNLRRKTEEFGQITDNMREGLVLLDRKGMILSVNPAACRLFQTDPGCVGKDFLTVDRSLELSKGVEEALEGGHSEVRIRRGGREYQFDISGILSEGGVLGAVLLVFDVTEQADAERIRREFTANVSHELKTPLQSIIGSAELLEKGMVRPEDLPRFVGHIREEAARLVTLINDIIRLSQLDEGQRMPEEEVDLRAMAEEVFSVLRDAADARNITLSAEGEGKLRGVRRLLFETLYNLCDNGIKYNADGGSVRVRIAETGDAVDIFVSDTGIGIPEEHQAHVFERFYRVDKGRSRQSGGTGLGLSIVKHAVQYHRGQVDLESTPGEGTTVHIRFPRKG